MLSGTVRIPPFTENLPGIRRALWNPIPFVYRNAFRKILNPPILFQIHTSLVHGRPGANETSPELLEFTRARYVRLRLMGLRGTQEPLPRWFTQDIWKDKRLFYSIRDISVGGQCVCNGHAENCRHNVASGVSTCCLEEQKKRMVLSINRSTVSPYVC